VKSFPFSFGGREYHLKKLDQNAKEDLVDRVTAGRLKRADRMHAKGYRTPAEYLSDQQAAYVQWGTAAFVTELIDDANAAAFVRAIVVEPLTDELVKALVAEQRKETSEFRTAITRMTRDDDPKAQTPPGSASTPTGGEQFSVTNPFPSSPTT
jgi:hypothetical protein